MAKFTVLAILLSFSECVCCQVGRIFADHTTQVRSDTLVVFQRAAFTGGGDGWFIDSIIIDQTPTSYILHLYYYNGGGPYISGGVAYDTIVVTSISSGSYQLVVNSYNYQLDSVFDPSTGTWIQGDTTLGDSDTSNFQILSHPEFSRAGRFAVFPNPAGDNLFITGKEPGQKLLLQILQADGRLVEEIALEPGQQVIPLAGLPAGAYLLKIRDEGSNGPAEILRFFKER